MHYAKFKKIKSIVTLPCHKPRYIISEICFETHIPKLNVIDLHKNQNLTIFSAMEIIAKDDMIKYFSVKDIKMICYCLSQEYYQMQHCHLSEKDK